MRPSKSAKLFGLFLFLFSAIHSTRGSDVQSITPPMVSSQLKAAITAALEPFFENHSIAGAVTLVATKDKVLAVDAVGFSDLSAGKRMKTDALFWIASQTKAMTAAALMTLVDQGKVNLDDPVEKYLPEFKGQMVVAERDADHVLLRRPPHPITLREVLSHTSGLPFALPIEQPTLDGLALQKSVHGYANAPLDFLPGSQYRYSNAGFNTVGRIIEVVSGMSYETFMEQQLFEPLGMKDTTFWPTSAQLKRLAKSYKPDKTGTHLEEDVITQLRYPLSDRVNRHPMPAGGIFSTALDTAKFCQMMLSGGVFNGRRVLSEESVRQMTSKQTGPDVKEEYGFGLNLSEDGFGHGGAYYTRMTVDRRRGLILIWMVQQAAASEGEKKSEETFNAAVSSVLGPHP